MIYNNLNLPATLVHSVNGKKYTLNGKLLSINESTKLATMQFGDKTNSNIPLNEVYLNEGALKDMIKKTGKKIKDAAIATWNKIKDIVKVVGGFLIPVDESGEELREFVNAPVNLPMMPLPSAVKLVPAEGALGICDEYGARVRNNATVDEAFAQSMKDEKDEIETYWTRVMREYANPENESLTLSETVKMVNETYYHATVDSKVLNEAAIPSLNSPSGLYGEKLGTKTLVRTLITNLKHQLNPITNHERTDEDLINQLRNGTNYVKPLLIWGAPGIGKTAILKQAAKFLKEDEGMNLDMVTVCCGGIKTDDFELPDTARNIIGRKVAISTPKTWLPVINIASLTDEQLLEANEFYNSGKFRILAPTDETINKTYDDNGEAKKAIDWKSLGTGETFDGGIIFFDEFARLRNLKVMDTMMTFVGDRTYVDMPLATNWVTVAAANRLSDDLLSEADPTFHGLWDTAKQSRFTHCTYAPSKEEWLEWARDVDDDGYQNVDELICKFIEKSPDGVWYDALDLGSRGDDAIEGRNAAAIKDVLAKWHAGTPLSAKELKLFGTYISNPGNSIVGMTNYTWNARTWHQKINKVMLSVLLNDFFKGDFKKYEACFDETTRVKSLYGGKGAKEYTAKNLNMDKLATQLNSIPDAYWDKITDGYWQKFDKDQNFRNNDRLAFFLECVQWLIQSETGGENSVPSQAWHQYRNIDSIIEDVDVRTIYEKGQMHSAKAAKLDNILCSQSSGYKKFNDLSWKSDPTLWGIVVERILKSFNDYITAEDLLTDINSINRNLKNIEKDPEKYNVTQKEIDDYINAYTIQFFDESKKPIEQVPTLLSEDLEDEDDRERIIIILRNSACARKLANVACWLAKLGIQINNNSPLDIALGTGEFDKKLSLRALLGAVIQSNPETKKYWFDAANTDVVQYDILKPALNILNSMKKIKNEI